MTSLQGLAAALSDALSRASPLAPFILFGATLVEYVFPPFPGDLMVVLGAWWAVQGHLSWPSAFAAVTAGALLGAWIDWRVGSAPRGSVRWRRPGARPRPARRHPPPRRGGAGASRGAPRTVVHRILTAERIARFEEGYRRWGGLLIAANRFLPGVRAFLFVAAGAARVPLGKVLLLGALSAVAWNALLLGAGALLARNLDELVALFDRYTQVVSTVLAAVLVAAAASWALRRRAARRREVRS